MSNNNTMTLLDASADVSLAPERVCYEAHWRDRSVYISAPCQSVREWQWHCLASAILLERLEDACVLAETMLESSLQFFVSELPGEGNKLDTHEKDYLRVQLKRASDDVEIWLPAGACSTVMQHGELIESSNLCWSGVSASLKIAHIVLDQCDADRLQKGALILIPASWQKPWLCTIDVRQLDRVINATLNPATHSIELDYANASINTLVDHLPSQNVVTAYLDHTVTIDLRSLLSAQSDTDEHGIEKILVSLEQMRCRCLLNGQHFVADLSQIGEGFGLCVQEYL